MLAIPSPIITKTHPALGSLPSRNKPIPLELIRDPPDFGIDSFDVLDMSPGPSSVLRVRRCGLCLALKCLWSGAFAPVEFTAGAVFDGRVLAGCFPWRVFAPHLRPGQSDPNRVARPDSVSASILV